MEREKVSNGEAIENDEHLVMMQRKKANSLRNMFPLQWGSKRPLDSQLWYFLQPYLPPLVSGHTAATVRSRI